MRADDIQAGVPKFTQVKRVTLRRASAGKLKVSLEMFAPISLHPGDQFGAEIYISPPLSNGTLTRVGVNSINVVFPLGYTYTSKPSLPSGSAGAVALVFPHHPSGDGAYFKLLQKLPCSISSTTLTATLDSKLLGESDLAWLKRFLYVVIRYAPATGAVFGSGPGRFIDDAIVDVEKINPALRHTSMMKPSHPEPQMSTTLPPAVRAKR